MKSSTFWLPEDFNEEISLTFRRPFHTFLIKCASLCNLNCSYCYVYNSPDESWKWKPKFLEKNIAQQIANRIKEHVLEHKLNEISIILHGGEPLLLGLENLVELVKIFSATIQCKIQYGMQTNGTLLNQNYIDFFIKNNFRVGISLDGTKEHNDKNRIYHNGKSSYKATVKAIELVQSRQDNKNIFGGILIVIDINNKPHEILDSLKSLGVHSVNILLPDGHYESLPPYLSDNSLAYGKWLYEFFQLWFNGYQEIVIPYFENIISMLLGGNSNAEEIGAQSVDFIVIDTNGDIEAVDTLKIVGREATSLHLNVYNNSFDEALTQPAIFSRMAGYNSLCKQCRNCEYLDNCGGGYLPHRYSKRNGFLNPTIYCEDLKYLFSKIKQDIF